MPRHEHARAKVRGVTDAYRSHTGHAPASGWTAPRAHAIYEWERETWDCAFVAASVLGCVGVAQAQNNGGIEWNTAEDSLEDTSGATLGCLYVPGPKHAQAGESIRVWDAPPWSETFEMDYVGSVTSYAVPAGWTEESFENGDLTSGAVPGGTLSCDDL